MSTLSTPLEDDLIITHGAISLNGERATCETFVIRLEKKNKNASSRKVRESELETLVWSGLGLEQFGTIKPKCCRLGLGLGWDISDHLDYSP